MSTIKEKFTKATQGSNSQLQIECLLFRYRGGAPPHRGFHFSSSITVGMEGKEKTCDLMRVVKERVDKDDHHELSYYLTKGDGKQDPKSKASKEEPLPKSKQLDKVFTEKSIKLRVNIPFARGCKDVGTFGMMVSSPGADILMGKNKDVSGFEVSHLLSHFEGAREDGGRFEEFSEVLTEKECEKICEFIDRRFERAGVNAVDDFQVTLQPQQLCELVSKERGSELLELFDAECHEIILRRSTSGGNFINFHIDQTLQTLNIPLNDAQSYQGGRLVYATEEGLIWPERKTGSATLHTNEIVHGVTPILEGVRYAMFLLHHKEE